jgi:hypothetical protein
VKKNICAPFAAMITWVILLLFTNQAQAADLFFQPRLETGVMYYAFESEAVNEAFISSAVPFNTGFGLTQKAFEFSGNLPFVGVGGTLFLNRFFLDISGQYASGGDDTTSIVYSAYGPESYDFDNLYINTAFMAAATDHAARFDRSDTAVSLGYAFTRRFSLYAGYKWAGTQFKTNFLGDYSQVGYNSDSDIDGPSAGRMWGEADFRFEYAGPFVGGIQSWDCGHSRFFRGRFTANLALAYLEGKVVLDRLYQYVSVDLINDQPVPEIIRPLENGYFARFNTKGNAWGLSFGLGWRGVTAWEGLSYSLGLSGYRYEFNAQENSQSDINETTVIFKVGLAYIF